MTPFSMLTPRGVRLSGGEMTIAAVTGTMRATKNLVMAAKGDAKHMGAERWGADHSNYYQRMIDGAVCECAWAKLNNLFWCGDISQPGKGDVGAHEIRSTQIPQGRLILHPEDDDDAVFILGIVDYQALSVTFRGWCLGLEGKAKKYWADPSKKGRPAFFVDELHDLSQLTIGG